MRQIKLSELKKLTVDRLSSQLPLEIVADGEVVACLVPVPQLKPKLAQIDSLAEVIPEAQFNPKKHPVGTLVRTRYGVFPAPARWY